MMILCIIYFISRQVSISRSRRGPHPPPSFLKNKNDIPERHTKQCHRMMLLRTSFLFFPDNYFITLYYSALQLFYCLFVFLLSPVYIQIFILMQTNDSLNTEQQKGIIYLIKFVFFSVFILLSLFSKPPPFLWVMNVLVCFVIPSTSPQFAA